MFDEYQGEQDTLKFNWVKPLKRSQKVRLRKELDKRKRAENLKLKETNEWVSNGNGAQIKIDKNMWGYQI